MELTLLLTFIRRWLWLLVLGLFLGLGTAWLLTQYQTPVYRASTKVMITGELVDPSGSTGRQSLQELVGTYTQLLLTRSVSAIASERLGYGVNPGRIAVQPVANTKLFQVHYESPDPERAADTANTLVQVLVEQNTALQTGRVAESVSGLETQIADIEDRITTLETDLTALYASARADQQATLEAKITLLEADLANAQREIVNLSAQFTAENTTDEGDVLPLSAQQELQLQEKQDGQRLIEQELERYRQALFDLTVLDKTGPVDVGSGSGSPLITQTETQLALYRQIYSNLLSEYELARMTNLNASTGVVLVDAAVAPSRPLRPQPVTNMIFGASLGLILAAMVGFVVEYVDDTVKSPQAAARAFDSSVIGHINFLRGVRDEPGTHAAAHPRSPVTESLRKLRTNLEFTKVDRPLRTLFVTSANPGEGKTTIVANLAVVMAQAGQRVIVVDADLRRPNLHNLLGAANRTGLTDVLIGRATVADTLQSGKDDYLSIMASGPIPPNPAELLRSTRMIGVMEELAALADILLIDGPPFVVADAVVLAARVDGVLPVVRFGRTRLGAITAMAEQLGQVQANVVGVVMNGVRPRGRSGYYGQYYYYESSYPEGAKPKRRWPFVWRGRRGET